MGTEHSWNHSGMTVMYQTLACEHALALRVFIYLFFFLGGGGRKFPLPHPTSPKPQAQELARRLIKQKEECFIRISKH